MTKDIIPIAVRYLKEAGATPALLMKAVEEMTAVSSKRSNASVKAVELPHWIPIEEWTAYITMRRQMRFTCSEAWANRAIQNLAKLGKAGNNPAEVLEQSTMQCWQGLFAVKGNNNGRLSFSDAARHLLGKAEEEGDGHTPESPRLLPTPAYDQGAIGYAGAGVLPRPEEL
jgi:hypothetical protein